VWTNNKVRHKPAYAGNDFNTLGMQVKFDTNPNLSSAKNPFATIKFDATVGSLNQISLSRRLICVFTQPKQEAHGRNGSLSAPVASEVTIGSCQALLIAVYVALCQMDIAKFLLILDPLALRDWEVFGYGPQVGLANLKKVPREPRILFRRYRGWRA
jgi:hypothetical protein